MTSSNLQWWARPANRYGDGEATIRSGPRPGLRRGAALLRAGVHRRGSLWDGVVSLGREGVSGGEGGCTVGSRILVRVTRSTLQLLN